MRTAFLSVIAIAVCCIAAPTANASILSDFLTFDGPVHHTAIPFQGGGEDRLQDDSRSAFFDNDNSGGFSDGDVIVAMVTISEVLASGRTSVGVGANSQIAILSSFTISGVGSVAGSFNLVATAAANANSLQSLMNSSIQASAGINANTIGVVMSTSTPDSVSDAINYSFGQIGNTSNGFSTTNGWNWEMTVGDVATSDFSEVTGNAATGGAQRGAFTVQSSAFSVPEWLKVDVLDFGLNTHLADITLDAATFNFQPGNGWTFRDQGTFFVNPAPEPGSIAIWSALLTIGCVVNGRRRRKLAV